MSLVRPLLIFGLVIGAVLVRLPLLDASTFTYHPIRQYRSAMIARDCFYRRSAEIPEPARAAARASRQMQPAGEPPLLEALACGAYLAAGRETLMVPRTLSMLSWLAGAWPLFWLARRVASPGAALVSLALYLLLPYTAAASTSFQPDALMTMAGLWAGWVLWRHHEKGGVGWTLAAGAAIATAALIKPMSIFFTFPMLAGLAVARHGVGGAMLAPASRLLLIVSLAPPAVYYGYGALFGTLARDQMAMRFVPDLLGSSFFWGGLLTQARTVFTLPVFAAAAVGTLAASPGAPRLVLAALWFGYLAYAVTFTYHVPTHDYYHLPFVPLMAWAVAVPVARAEAWLSTRGAAGRARWLPLAVAALAALAGASLTPRSNPAADAQQRVQRFREIGALIAHDTRVVFLDHEYGYPLMYHGELSGDAWPNADDLAAEAFGGAGPVTAPERFARDFAEWGPHFFVVTDLGSFAQQPDLQAFLARAAEPVAATSTYRIYRFPSSPL